MLLSDAVSNSGDGKVTFSVILDEDDHRILTELAQEDERSLSGEVRLALKAWIKLRTARRSKRKARR